MKRFLFLLSALYITVQASANGGYLVNGMYYSIISETNKWVQLGMENSRYSALTEYVATVNVPSTVVIDGTTYTVKRIGNNAFTGCSYVTTVIIPSTVTSIGYDAFGGSGITTLEIPNTVTSIDEYAFSSCYSLTSIKLPNKLQILKGNIFYNCPNLYSLSIPNGVQKLNEEAFSAYFNAVTIPPSVKIIDSHAIYGCVFLWWIYLRNSNPYSMQLGNDIMAEYRNFTTFLVPPGSKVSYQGAPQWGRYKLAEEGSNALHFDGVNDYVSLPMQFYKHGAFTIEMWIKPDAIPATGIVSLLNTNSWNTDANGASAHFQISDSKLSLAVNGINDGHPTSSYTPIPNVWQHIAVTYARGIAVKFYVNGNLVSTVTKGYVMPLAKIDDACLGSWGGTSRFFNGAIDEVRVWNEVLTEEQIRDNMNVSFENTSNNFPINQQYINPYLSLNYNFNHGIDSQYNKYATNLTDYSGSRWDGTLKNYALDGTTSNFVKGVDFPILYVSSKTDTISSANNSNDTIKVSSNVKWHVQSDQSWLKANVDSLIGNGEFILTATQNPTNALRTATVTVSATGTVTKTIAVTQIANISTGIESPSKKILTLLPNPVSNGFSINMGERKSTLSIYNSNGILVLLKQIEGKSYVDITSLPSGVYMLKVNGMVEKIIKK